MGFVLIFSASFDFPEGRLTSEDNGRRIERRVRYG